MSNSDTNPETPDWKKLASLSDADIQRAAMEARGEKLDELLEKHKAQLPILEKMAELVAQARFANYSALVKSGFTPEQAMFLIVNGK